MSKRSTRLGLLAATSMLVAAPLIVAGTLVGAQPVQPRGDDAPTMRPMPAQFHGGHGPSRGRGGPGGLAGPERMHDLFEEVDADGDGTVTQEEIDAFRTTQFEGADTSGDGAVSLDEFSVVYFERMRPRMVDAFQAIDEDGDGSVTSAELEERFDDAMRRLDRDGDGTLTMRRAGADDGDDEDE